MIIFINNKSTKFCQITQCIKRLIHKKKSGSFFLPHGVHTFKYIFTRWTMDFLIWSQILPSWPNTSAWRTHQVCVTFISISAGYQLSSFYFTCCIKVAHTRTRLPSVGFRSWSRFLAVSSQVTWVINPETRWVWTVSPRLLPDSVAAANLKPGPSAPVSSTLTTLTCCTILYILYPIRNAQRIYLRRSAVHTYAALRVAALR